MTFNEFINKYLGTKVDYDGAYGGQCVDLFRQYVKDVLGYPQPLPVTGAKDFWFNFSKDLNLSNCYVKIPNMPDAIPQKGDVMIWDAWSSNPYGHISIYIEGDVMQFISLDQNYPTLSKVTKTTHNYTNPKVLGWLRPIKNMNLFDPELDLPTWLEDKYDLKSKEWYNKSWNFGDLVDKTDELYKTEQELKAEIDTLNERERISDQRRAELESVVSERDKMVTTLNNEINRLKNEIEGVSDHSSQVEKENQDLLIEIQELKARLESESIFNLIKKWLKR